MKFRITMAVIALFVFCSFARADAAVEPKSMLFAGHSFFHPVASKFEDVVQKLGVEGHSQEVIVAGGKTGSPEALWFGDKAEEIKQILDVGDVDIFGLTFYSEENSGVEDYRRWIEYALGANPDTSFLIGLPWGKYPAEKTTAEYRAENQFYERLLTDIVTQLETEYSETAFLFLNYGRGAVELRRMLEAGEMPESTLTGDGKTAIYTDETGHAGNILGELSVWLWVPTLYPDVELSGPAVSSRPAATLAARLGAE